MKNFLILLAKGLAIAVFIALVFCYFLWCVDSVRRLIWFFVVFATIIYIEDYWLRSVSVTTNVEGESKTRPMTKKEKIMLLLKRCGIVVFNGLVMYGLGIGCAEILNLAPQYWEMYMVCGMLACLAMISIAVFIAYVITLIADSTKRKNFLHALKLFVGWIIVIICSLAVFFIILYYLFPLAVESKI